MMRYFIIPLFWGLLYHGAVAQCGINIEGHVNRPHVWKPPGDGRLSLKQMLAEAGGMTVNAFYVIVVREAEAQYEVYKFRGRFIREGKNKSFRLRDGDYVWVRPRESALNNEQGLLILPKKIRRQIVDSKKARKMFDFSRRE